MEPAELDALANAFFGAIEKGDLAGVEALYDPDARVWVNVTGQAQTREQNLRLLDRFTTSVSGLRYEVHAREFFPGGFVQRHTLHGTAPGGESLAVPVCLVIHASDGTIDRLYEYLDGAAVAPAFARP